MNSYRPVPRQMERHQAYEKDILFNGDDSKFAPSALEGENAEVEQAVRETPGAISYLGFAYLGDPNLRVLAIDNVKPTKENMQAGTWPIGGPGYVITKGPPSDIERAFITLLTSAEFQNSPAFAQLGYVPIIH